VIEPLPGGDLVAETPLWKRWLLVGLAVVMVAICSQLVFQPHESWLPWLGVPGLAFFGPCLAYALYRAVRPRPALVLRPEGFVDQVSAPAVGFVAWEDVEAIRTIRVFGQAMVAIKLGEPDLMVGRLRPWKRWVVALNRRFYGAEVFLPAMVLPTTAAEFAETMDRWRRQRQG
jgi:hypothetical protein